MHVLERRRESRSSPAAEMGSKSTTFPYSPPSSSTRSRPYVKLLLLAFAAAALCVFVFHNLKEKRVLGLLLEEHELELHSLHALLQKEKVISEEMKKKFEEMKETAVSLRSQKSSLTQELAEAQNVAGYLKERQRELESAQAESQGKIKMLAGLESDFAKAKNRIKLLKKELQRQGDKFEALKRRLEFLSSKQGNATAAGSEIHVNQTLPSDIVDGESQDDGLRAREVDLEEEKPIVNGTLDTKTEEQEEGIQGKGEWEKLTTNADNEDGSEENVLKQVAESEGNGTSLERNEQTGNQTGPEDKVLAAEDLFLLNKTDGQEQENSKFTEPDIPADSSHEEKPQETDLNEKDEVNFSKMTKDHANPIKQRRRRHRSLVRSGRGEEHHGRSLKSKGGMSLAEGENGSQEGHSEGADGNDLDLKVQEDGKNKERSGYLEMVNSLGSKK